MWSHFMSIEGFGEEVTYSVLVFVLLVIGFGVFYFGYAKPLSFIGLCTHKHLNKFQKWDGKTRPNSSSSGAEQC